MNSLPPELLTVLDLLGASIAFWLALHLATHGWGWSRGRATQAALAFAGLALVFALAAWDDAHPLAGAGATEGWLRLLMIFFPIAWLGLARRLVPPALQARTLFFALGAGLLALVPVTITVFTVLINPEMLGRSWYFLPAYLAYSALALGLTLHNTMDARGLVNSATERGVLLAYAIATCFAILGIVALTTDMVFGLGNPPLPDAVRLQAPEIRFIGTVCMLVAVLLLWWIVTSTAQTDGALHLSAMRLSFLATVVLVAVMVGATWTMVRGLPNAEQIIFVVLALALSVDWLNQSVRTQLERLFYRGESGTLRQTLYRVLDALDPVYGSTPPAIRPLINNLARQLNVPQLGLALPDEKDNKKFRIVVSTNPKWEGQELPVTSPDVWHERGHDGWNMPLRKDGRTVGMVASSGSRAQSRVQEHLLNQAVSDIVQLLDEWGKLAGRRARLQEALDSYWRDEEAFERQSGSIVLDTGPRQDLRRQLQHFFANYNEPTVISNHALTKLQLVDSVAGTSSSGTSRSETLRQILVSLIDQLRPAKTTPPENPTGEWIPYVVMNEIYVKGRAPEELMGRLRLAPAALQRVQSQAIGQIAHLLAELEAGVMRQHQRKAALTAPAKKPALTGAFGRQSSASPSTPSTAYGGGSSYGSGSSYGGSSSTSGFGSGSTGSPSYGSKSVGGGAPSTPMFGNSGTGGGTSPKPDDGKKSGFLGGVASRFGKSGDTANSGTAPKPKSEGDARGGMFGGLTSRFGKSDDKANDGKITPKPTEGGGLKDRFGGIANLGSGLTSRFNKGSDDKKGGTDKSNDPTTVNPAFVRRPPSVPPASSSSSSGSLGSGSSMGGSSGMGSIGNSGMSGLPGMQGMGGARSVPKPAGGPPDPRGTRPRDPYGFQDDFPDDPDDMDDDEFDRLVNDTDF